ncbi:MAG: hypothetical protein ACYTFG_15055, partial [Planctomycetota bacterium]
MKLIRAMTHLLSLGPGLFFLLGITLAVFGAGCSSGDSGGGEETSTEDKEKPKRKKKRKRTTKKSGAGTQADPAPVDSSGKERPPVEPKELETPSPAAKRRLQWTFPEGVRFSYQVRFEFEAKKGESVTDRFRIDGTRFLRCVKGDGAVFPIVRLEPNPVEEIAAGEPVRHRAAATAELLKLTSTGSRAARESELRDRLLFGMGEPLFPETPLALGATWTVERDFEEGRFAFTYQLERETEIEGTPCLAIRLAVALPGGAPCDDFSIQKGDGVIWFDDAQGTLIRSMGNIEYTRGVGEEAAK